MRKHWTALLGALFVAPTVLQFIKWCWTAFKWGLDWIGRIEILASYSEKAGQIFEYLINPPASFFLLILGMGLIYLDVRRQGLPWAVQFAQSLRAVRHLRRGWHLTSENGLSRTIYAALRTTSF